MGTRALFTTEIFGNEHRYMTRSKTEIADKSKFNTDVKSSDDTAQRKNEENETSNQSDVSLTREINNERINQSNENNRNEETVLDFQNFNFDTSVWDRKFNDVDDIESEEITSDETPFNETQQILRQK